MKRGYGRAVTHPDLDRMQLVDVEQHLEAFHRLRLRDQPPSTRPSRAYRFLSVTVRASRSSNQFRVIKPIDIAEHCVLCSFQEVIRDLVREGAQARQVHNGESEAGDYPVYELDYGGERLAVEPGGFGAAQPHLIC